MKTFLTFFLFLLSLHFNYSQNLDSQIDNIISSVYTSNQPGISILVAKEGKTIYKKAFGVSNLELEKVMTPKNVFEIGSITKQFTAVSILMLEEQGKLNVEDEITKYIPDYPTRGKIIKIRHLLNHTSGIKGNTPVSDKNMAKTDMTPKELINYFKNKPMNFDPGEQFRYSNSGYILLGYIIEMVTGQSYADFIEKNIFEKLDMNSSYVGNPKNPIKDSAFGYKHDQGNYVDADYLNLTIPYAAGAIMSTVDDLLKWQNAISANTLIKKTSLEKAINPSSLNNGKKIPYGYGWRIGNLNGSPVIAHNGGTYGYTATGIFLPNENIYVIALSNCNCKKVQNVSRVAVKVAAIAIGKPIFDINNAITLSDNELKKWIGAYQFNGNIIRHISMNDNYLYSFREGEGSRKYKLYPMKEDMFVFDDGKISYKFSITKDGLKQIVMKLNGEEYLGQLIDKAPPIEEIPRKVSSNILKKYSGKYEVKPNINITITINDNTIFLLAPGQTQKIELLANQDDHFSLKDIPAQIIFNSNERGGIESLILKQNGQQVLAKKIE